MMLQLISVKKHRLVALDPDEIIALDYNESLHDLKIYLRGGGSLSLEGKRATKIWKHLSENLSALIPDESHLADES